MISKKLLVCMFLLCGSVFAQTTETFTSLNGRLLNKQYDELSKMDDSVFGSNLYIKLDALFNLKKYDDILNYSDSVLKSKQSGMLYKIYALTYSNKYIETIQYGLLSTLDNTSSTFGTMNDCDVLYLQSLKALNRQDIISNIEFSDIFTTNTVCLQTQLESIVWYYLDAFKVTNTDKSLELHSFLKLYFASNENIVIPDQLFIRILTNSNNVDILTDWIRYQANISVSKYTIPYYGFIRKFNGIEDKTKILDAIQYVSLSDKCDVVSNSHLKLLQKLNMIK